MIMMIMMIKMIMVIIVVSIHPDCVVPESELRLAKKNYQWWKSFLGDYYRFSTIISLVARSHIGFEKHEEEKMVVIRPNFPNIDIIIQGLL